MQDFIVESKTSGISSLSTSWQGLEVRYKSSNEVNLTPRSPRTKPEKMENFEDPVRKLLNLVGQGASSNSKRNWWQVHTCSWGKTLEDSGTNWAKDVVGWAEVGLSRPAQPISWPPFDLAAIQAIYSPEARRHASILSSSAAEEQRSLRDTISERRVVLVV
jgi:hypothetical protein